MGSSGSKHNAVESSASFSSASSSSSVVRRNRLRGSRVFQSSCLGLASGSRDDDDDEQVSNCERKGNNVNNQSLGQVKSESDQGLDECFSEVKAEQSDEITFISSSSELDEWDQSNLSDAVCKAGSSSSARSSIPSSRFLSRFSFIPSNASFRLNRTASLGSSRAYPGSSTNFTVANQEDDVVQTGSSTGLVVRNEYSRARFFLPACLNNQSSSPLCGGPATGNLESNPTISGFSDNLGDDQISSVPNGPIQVEDPRVQLGISLHSPRNQIDLESIEIRTVDRRVNVREPTEGNVHFSRTLSVGRLRDRVLRRSLTPDLAFPSLQQESESVVPPQREGVPDLGVQTGPLPSNDNASVSSTPSITNSAVLSSTLSLSQDREVQLASRSRETRYHDLLEHRSNFLERRRRIRSQVRALQRLGSRFENLSGHERSCIISGQHRTGHCTCRVNNREAGSTDDGGATASISRIVMLAEALFEVLDEIHQQSVVLSSRPSVSSIGSVPAPSEVVDALPMKVFSKSHKHSIEDTSQCYICLVEYEEGDSVRILPCHHDFHGTCVDKWLKEVHRVCPLCRRDICRTADSVTPEG